MLASEPSLFRSIHCDGALEGVLFREKIAGLVTVLDNFIQLQVQEAGVLSHEFQDPDVVR